MNGKSDTLDAENAARATLAGMASATPKTADGTVEMLRLLKVVHGTAVKDLTVNDLYKTEPIYARPNGTAVTEVEYATMDWVHWRNIRLHQALDCQTLAEGEAQYYRERASVLASA